MIENEANNDRDCNVTYYALVSLRLLDSLVVCDISAFIYFTQRQRLVARATKTAENEIRRKIQTRALLLVQTTLPTSATCVVNLKLKSG